MNAQTERRLVAGPVGSLEVAIDESSGTPVPIEAAQANARPAHAPLAGGLALVCHPHPLHGGTLDNKVVQTLVRAFLPLGLRCVRLNYRGVGRSEGQWAEGPGECDDALAVLDAFAQPGQAIVLAGFSFGGYVAASIAQRLQQQGRPPARVVLIGPATVNFPVPPAPADTLVVHGEADDVVPLQATLDWARPQSLPVVVIPGVGHFFHGQLPLLKSVVQRAFAPGLSLNS